MAAHKGPASVRPRCTRGGSSVAAIPVYQPSFRTDHHLRKLYLHTKEIPVYENSYSIITYRLNILCIIYRLLSLFTYITPHGIPSGIQTPGSLTTIQRTKWMMWISARCLLRQLLAALARLSLSTCVFTCGLFLLSPGWYSKMSEVLTWNNILWRNSWSHGYIKFIFS
jgi:hypothetical protein